MACERSALPTEAEGWAGMQAAEPGVHYPYLRGRLPSGIGSAYTDVPWLLPAPLAPGHRHPLSEVEFQAFLRQER